MWLARQKELMAVRDSSNGGALILNEPRNTHTHTHTHHNQGNEIWGGKDPTKHDSTLYSIPSCEVHAHTVPLLYCTISARFVRWGHTGSKSDTVLRGVLNPIRKLRIKPRQSTLAAVCATLVDRQRKPSLPHRLEDIRRRPLILPKAFSVFSHPSLPTPQNNTTITRDHFCWGTFQDNNALLDHLILFVVASTLLIPKWQRNFFRMD